MSDNDHIALGKVVKFPDQLHAAPRPLDSRDDDELMLLAASGNTQAFNALVERHITGLANYCAKVTGDMAEAEELAGVAFTRIWKARQRYAAQGKFKVFLFTAARNACFNYRRSIRRRLRKETSDSASVKPVETADQQPNQLDYLIQLERESRIRKGLAKLPRRIREALLLRFEQDLDYAEISAIVGRSESTVRSRVFHGLKKMRTILESEAVQ